MSYKDQQKELKQPDEFQKLGQEAVPWVEKHSRSVMMGAGAVLGVGLLAGIASSLASRSEDRASKDFGAALRVLERPVNASATETKPGDEPAFKTEAEKDEAIVKGLTEVRSQHAGKTAAISAALPLAQALLRQGKADQALPLLEEYLAKGDPADPVRPAALEARGYALEAQGKLDEALAAFDTLARETRSDFLKGMGQYHRGRLLMAKGDGAGAAKAFSEIEGAAPGSAAARMAKDRIATLVAQGVSVPTPPAPTTVPAPAPTLPQ